MGHERVGALPRTKRWRDVVHGIAEASSLDGDVHGLANATLRNVRQRLQDVPADTGFVASFEFLLGLAVSARAQGKAASPRTPTINLEENPSALRLARALAEYVTDRRQSAEYAEIARKAATDVIATWTQEQTRQLTITGDHERSAEIWSRASDGRGFCEVSRLFFGKFVERYLNYFIGREASAYLSTTEDRERLARRLAEHTGWQNTSTGYPITRSKRPKSHNRSPQDGSTDMQPKGCPMRNKFRGSSRMQSENWARNCFVKTPRHERGTETGHIRVQ